MSANAASRTARLALAATAALALGACTATVNERGFLRQDTNKFQTVRVGVDTRDSIALNLGSPSNVTALGRGYLVLHLGNAGRPAVFPARHRVAHGSGHPFRGGRHRCGRGTEDAGRRRRGRDRQRRDPRQGARAEFLAAALLLHRARRAGRVGRYVDGPRPAVGVDRLTGSCHCGAVSVDGAARAGDCDQLQLFDLPAIGRAVGVFPVSEVAVTGETQAYVQGDKTLATHRCTACGCVSHWSPLDPSLTDGRQLAPDAEELLDVPRVRKFDGRDVDVSGGATRRLAVSAAEG